MRRFRSRAAWYQVPSLVAFTYSISVFHFLTTWPAVVPCLVRDPLAHAPTCVNAARPVENQPYGRLSIPDNGARRIAP